MSTTDNDEQIERISKKTRKHLYISQELDESASEILPGYVQFSTWAEEKLWEALVEEYGREAVVEAIEEVQNEFDEEDVLPPNARDELGLPA